MQKLLFYLLLYFIGFGQNSVCIGQKKVIGLGLTTTPTFHYLSIDDNFEVYKFKKQYSKMIGQKEWFYRESDFGTNHITLKNSEQLGLGVNFSYFRYTKPRKLNMRTGLTISHFSRKFSEEYSIVYTHKATVIDSSMTPYFYDGDFLNLALKKSTYSSKVIVFYLPIDVFYNIKNWSLGVGASLQLPLFYGQRIVYINQQNDESFGDIPKRETGSINLGLQTSILRWFNKNGIELSANTEIIQSIFFQDYSKLIDYQVLPIQVNLRYLRNL